MRATWDFKKADRIFGRIFNHTPTDSISRRTGTVLGPEKDELAELLGREHLQVDQVAGEACKVGVAGRVLEGKKKMDFRVNDILSVPVGRY